MLRLYALVLGNVHHRVLHDRRGHHGPYDHRGHHGPYDRRGHHDLHPYEEFQDHYQLY